MKKNDITNYIIRHTNLSKSQASKAVDCVFNAIAESLEQGENVFLRGFATIKVHRSPAKKARNITKGTMVMIPPQNTAKIIMSKELKKRMNK